VVVVFNNGNHDGEVRNYYFDDFQNLLERTGSFVGSDGHTYSHRGTYKYNKDQSISKRIWESSDFDGVTNKTWTTTTISEYRDNGLIHLEYEIAHRKGKQIRMREWETHFDSTGKILKVVKLNSNYLMIYEYFE
jgi:hypothetical protein